MVLSSLEQRLQSQPPHLGKSITGFLQSLQKVPGSGTIWIEFATWRVCLPCPTANRSHSKPPWKRRLDQPEHNSSLPRRIHELSWPQATAWQNFRTISRKKDFSQLLPPNLTVQVWPACPHPVTQCGPTGHSLTQEQAEGTASVWHTLMKRHFITQTLESTRIKVQCFCRLQKHLFLVHGCHLGNILFISSFIFNLNEPALPAC